MMVLSQSKHYITTFFLFLANFKNQLKYYNTITLILYNVEVRKEKNEKSLIKRTKTNYRNSLNLRKIKSRNKSKNL